MPDVTSRASGLGPAAPGAACAVGRVSSFTAESHAFLALGSFSCLDLCSRLRFRFAGAHAPPARSTVVHGGPLRPEAGQPPAAVRAVARSPGSRQPPSAVQGGLRRFLQSREDGDPRTVTVSAAVGSRRARGQLGAHLAARAVLQASGGHVCLQGPEPGPPPTAPLMVGTRPKRSLFRAGLPARCPHASHAHRPVPTRPPGAHPVPRVPTRPGHHPALALLPLAWAVQRLATCLPPPCHHPAREPRAAGAALSPLESKCTPSVSQTPHGAHPGYHCSAVASWKMTK